MDTYSLLLCANGDCGRSPRLCGLGADEVDWLIDLIDND
jgi:hypothetical protein